MADLEDREGETRSSIISLPLNGHYLYFTNSLTESGLIPNSAAEKATKIVKENGAVVKLTDLVGRKTEESRNAILARGEDLGLISISSSSGWVWVKHALLWTFT